MKLAYRGILLCGLGTATPLAAQRCRSADNETARLILELKTLMSITDPE